MMKWKRRFSSISKVKVKVTPDICGLSLILFPCVLVSMIVVLYVHSSEDHHHQSCSDLASVVQPEVEVVLRGRGSEVTSLSRPVDCRALMEGDEAERMKASLYMGLNPRPRRKEAELIQEAKDCEAFRMNGGYDAFPVSQAERDFPVAFSILVHTDAFQVERLLKVIHRPQNLYCIHIDAKAETAVLDAIRAIADCFPNVFIPSKQLSITYAHFSRLQADLNCMEELVQRSSAWKYVINLTGQMFPLKTNLEIVKILQTFGGFNDIEGLSRYVSNSMKVRYKYRHVVAKGKLKSTRELKPPPPHNIYLVKGSAYGAFTRPFVEYVLFSPVVQQFLNWTKDIYSPDEFFWASLNSRWSNPVFKSPGGHDLPPERKPWVSAYAAWKKKDKCGGKFVRDVCIFGVSDLPSLIGRRELFANKFYSDFEYLTLDCIEEWLQNKTKRHLPIDLEYYRNMRLSMNDL